MKARLGGWTTIISACVALGAAPIAVLGVTVSGSPAGAVTPPPPALVASPTSLSFPETTLGDIRFMNVTVTNNSTTTADTVSGFSASGANPNDFVAFPGTGCSSVVFPITIPDKGASCSIAFGFNPGTLGARSATLTLTDTLKSNASVSMTGTGGIGYYQVSSNGAVAAFGDAALFGDASKLTLGHPIVGMAQTGDDGGYWLVASDGGIFSYGDASFYGSTGAIHLNKPIVGMAPTPDSGGYWLVASDGGIFSYGDAQFYGSTGAMHLNQPIVGMASTPDGGGYWLVAADGGVFSYGNAVFHGSTGALHLAKPIVGTAPMPTGNGYWFTASDGGLFNFGDAPFSGAAASHPIGTVVGMATDGAPTVQAVTDQPALRHLVPAGGRGGWSSAVAGVHVEHG